MKKISAIFLLLVFLFSTMGYYVFYSIQLHQAKRTMERQVLAGLPDSLLVTIEGSDALSWHEDGREFSLNGEMYDVVRSVVKDGKTIYSCVNDKKEKELLNRLSQATRTASQPAQGKGGKLLFSLQLARPADVPDLQPGWTSYTSREKYPDYNERLISSYKEILIPPPRA